MKVERTMKVMFRFPGILAIVLALGATAGMVRADSFNLSASNGGIDPASTDYGTITLNFDTTSPGCSASSACIKISVAMANGYAMRNTDFGFDIASGFSGVSVTNVSCSGSSGITCSAENGKNMSSFGNFDDAIKGGSGSSSYVTALTFDVQTTTAGGFTSLADAEVKDDKGYDFAAEVTPVPCDKCGTGFAGANVLNVTPTPEPGTLGLFATGLVGTLAFIVRRRF
jgi:hypothetical protein